MQLLVQGGADSGKSFDLNQPLLVIGRQIGSDITLNDGQVSRQHLRVENRGGLIFVTDLGSANGSFINGQRLNPQNAQPLRPGDRLKLGDTLLILEGGPSAAPPTQAAPYSEQRSNYQQYNQPAQPPQPPSQPSNYQQYNQPQQPPQPQQPGNYSQYNQPAQPSYGQYNQPATPPNNYQPSASYNPAQPQQPGNFQPYNQPVQPSYGQYNQPQSPQPPGYGNSYQPSQPGIYQQPAGYNPAQPVAPVRKKGNGGIIALISLLVVAIIAAVMVIIVVLNGNNNNNNNNNANNGPTPAVVSPGVPTPTRDPSLPTVTPNPNLPTVTPNPNNPTPATSPVAPTPTGQSGNTGTNPPPPPPNGSGNAPATTAVAVQTTAVAVVTTAPAVATTAIAVATPAPGGNAGAAGTTEAYNMSVTFPAGWVVTTDDGRKQISATSPDKLSGVTMLNTDQQLPSTVQDALQAFVDELKKSQPNLKAGQINIESGGKQASVRVEGKDASGRNQIVDVYLLEGDDGTGFLFAFQSVAQTFPTEIFRNIRSSIRFG